MARQFAGLLEARWAVGRHLCVGLDPVRDSLPDPHRADPDQVTAFVGFCREIVTATHDFACAYKPNAAFFEALGGPGLDALAAVVAHIHDVAPEIPIIYDAKRGDIGTTNAGTVTHAFDRLGADAITVSPYLGQAALEPFLERADKGVFVLCRTSNVGAGEFQDIETESGVPLFEVVAERVANDWNGRGNCGLVMGATDPVALTRVRAIVGDMPILVPGVGAQGGDLAATLVAGGSRVLINASRSILYASAGDDFAEAARGAAQALHDAIAAGLGQ